MIGRVPRGNYKARKEINNNEGKLVKMTQLTIHTCPDVKGNMLRNIPGTGVVVIEPVLGKKLSRLYKSTIHISTKSKTRILFNFLKMLTHFLLYFF